MTDGLIVKLADLGLAKKTKEGYYRRRGNQVDLPIRSAAPEVVEMEIYTEMVPSNLSP